MDPKELKSRIIRGGPAKYHQKNKQAGKLFVRQRIDLLLDEGSEFVEDGLFANCNNEKYPADAVVTGFGQLHGKVVGIIANDSTVKAGSWGPLTVEKMIRLQEEAERLRAPIMYLIDSAGARITDQIAVFPGRRGAGRIFYNQVRLSGFVPQVCVLFGPCAAGGAYVPAFCDVTLMVEKNASMYLGSPRMAEVVIGEKVSHEEMGGTELHTTKSGCADLGCASEEEAITWVRKWMKLWFGRQTRVPFEKAKPKQSLREIIPEASAQVYDIHRVIDHILDDDSFMEIKPSYAAEIVCGIGTLEGMVVGVVASQPKVKGGVLFSESADKAARFIEICHAYEIPLLFLCDVPGFMIGSAVERQGIIRRGARLIQAISMAAVPKISLVIRKAYGAGLYAMCGPAFEPDCCLALPSARIAVMGPGPAVNAVHFNHIAAIEDPEERASFFKEKTEEYLEDIDIQKLASELIVDHVIDFDDVRKELVSRFNIYKQKITDRLPKRHTIQPL